MTVLLSAAHTEATPSHASKPLSSQRYAVFGNALRAAPLPRVEFIYTPDNLKIDLTFNGLCSAGRWQPQPFHRKYVDDLDSSLSEPLRGASLRDLSARASDAKPSHNGHCVTLEPRPRCNMSYRRPPRAGWHACCLYNRQERRSALGKEASKLADTNKAWIWNEAGMPVGYHVCTGQQ